MPPYYSRDTDRAIIHYQHLRYSHALCRTSRCSLLTIRTSMKIVLGTHLTAYLGITMPFHIRAIYSSEVYAVYRTLQPPTTTYVTFESQHHKRPIDLLPHHVGNCTFFASTGNGHNHQQDGHDPTRIMNYSTEYRLRVCSNFQLGVPV